MSIFGQVWVFSAIAFVLGAFLAWVFLVRPARKQIRSLEERLVAREADLRRISEPALGAAGTAQTRTERSDPFSDADEALAGTGSYAGGADVDAGGRPEPETSWLERDSLGGYAGGHAGGGYEDDFDLADRPEDLEIPGDRGAHDADYEAGYSDGYRAFAPADDGHERYDATGYDATGYDEAAYDEAYDDAGYGEHPDDRTRYVPADAGADEDAPVSSVLDPDEMRSAPGPAEAGAGLPDVPDAPDVPDVADAESTRFIGAESLPGAGDVADAAASDRAAASEERDADPAGDQAGTAGAAGSALHLGAPFQPVTSFDATTEFSVDALRDSGLDDPARRSGGAGHGDPAGPADPADPAPRDRDDADDQPTHRAERPGSLFDPAPVGDDAADAPDAGVPGAGAPDVDRPGADTQGEPEAAAEEPVAADTGDLTSNGAGELPADPPAYAFGGPDAGPDEDPAESTNVLPKRTPRQRPPGGFDAPKPVQPSMRAVTRREPDAAVQSGSLFEPASPGESSSSEPAAEPAADAGPQTGQPPSDAQQLTKFVTPAGQVPTEGEAVSGELGASETGAATENAAPDGAVAENSAAEQADQADADVPKPGPFGPGSAMPLPGGGSPSPEFTVKASVTALRYVTDASPQYPRMVAEVWFRSPADAERVGFRPLS